MWSSSSDEASSDQSQSDADAAAVDDDDRLAASRATVLAAGSSRAVSSTIWVDIVRICGLISLTFTLSTADWASGPFVVDISEPTHAGGF